MTYICPICGKEIKKKIKNHLIKIHHFEWYDAHKAEDYIIEISYKNYIYLYGDYAKDKYEHGKKEMDKLILKYKSQVMQNTKETTLFDF